MNTQSICAFIMALFTSTLSLGAATACTTTSSLRLPLIAGARATTDSRALQAKKELAVKAAKAASTTAPLLTTTLHDFRPRPHHLTEDLLKQEMMKLVLATVVKVKGATGLRCFFPDNIPDAEENTLTWNDYLGLQGEVLPADCVYQQLIDTEKRKMLQAFANRFNLHQIDVIYRGNGLLSILCHEEFDNNCDFCQAQVSKFGAIRPPQPIVLTQ